MSMRALTRRWITVQCVLQVAALGLGWVVSGHAADIVVETEHRGARLHVRARASVSANLHTVWEVITDYENLPRFVPGLTRSIVRRNALQSFELEQHGEVRFLFWSIPIDVVMQVTEEPRYRIVSRALRGNLRFMQARYELVAGPAPHRMTLYYQGEIEPDFELPPIFGAFALQSSIEEQFSAVVREIERRAEPTYPTVQ